MNDPPPYYLDIEGLEDAASEGNTPDARPWIGLHFACCDVYIRIYRNREQTKYVGNCPKCSRPVSLRIGPAGTSSRFFIAE